MAEKVQIGPLKSSLSALIVVVDLSCCVEFISADSVYFTVLTVTLLPGK